MADLATERQNVFDYVMLMLADGLVDVELDPAHLNMALDQALMVYKQRASNATEESYGFLSLVADQQEYILDDNIMEVRQIFRRSIGSSNASQFEPFEAGFINTYMLQNGRVGGLANYELFTGYQEQAMKMFGGHIVFTFEPVSKKLTLVRKIRSDGEEVMLWLYNKKPDVTLLQDHMIVPWLRKYTLGTAKIMLGTGRGKFSTVVGPGGGTTLDGDALKGEGTELIAECEQDIMNFVTGSAPLTWVQG